MTEIPLEVYQKEYFYIDTVRCQEVAFDELLTRFPDDDEEVKAFLNAAHGEARIIDPTRLLYPARVVELKQIHPEVYARISPIYSQFLLEKAGLA